MQGVRHGALHLRSCECVPLVLLCDGANGVDLCGAQSHALEIVKQSWEIQYGGLDVKLRGGHL